MEENQVNSSPEKKEEIITNQESESDKEVKEPEIVAEAEESQENDAVVNLEAELKAAKAEAQEFKDKYLRSVAEMENLRKRTAKERSDLLKYGNEKILEDLLAVLDGFEKAVQVSDENTSLESYIEGTQMVFNQLSSVLDKHGLKGFESQGKEFDPNLHQAIQRIESEEVETETVKDEFQKGYTLNERLLRPAIVSVLVPQDKA